MAAIIDDFIRDQLVERRHKLEHAVEEPDHPARLRQLLEEVDSALARIENGSFGICEHCHDAIECDRLIADPLLRFCLDHLSRQEKSALEEDLQLAARIQRGLLPAQEVICCDWHICYHYEPAGLVSGDYCDVIDADEAGLYFMVGDVSGKGVAASMLMAHLHAMFRTLTSIGLPLKGMLEHASRVFSKSTLPSQYATLVCGRALPGGKVEICNAGHPAPFVVRHGDVSVLETSNLPVGMFSKEEFSVSELDLALGESIVIYSDGVSEAMDASGSEYGVERLSHLLRRKCIDPLSLIATCREDLATFRGGAQKADDVTLLVLNRAANLNSFRP